MTTNADVVVVGLGAVGGAALCHVAGRGLRAVGIDRFTPPHDRGSSHGRTRIYRQAYYEAPEYVPLARRALELWRDLERDTRFTLFAGTGALTIGAERGALFSGAYRSARMHGIPHEVLSARDAARRFPAVRPAPDTVALFEPTGGVLFPEACVRAHLSRAAASGASIRTDEEVTAIELRGDGSVAVATSRGAYTAGHVVVAAGAWAPRLLGLERAFTVTRETVHWFNAPSPHARAEVCPVMMVERDDGPMLYAIPDFGDGFKAGLHYAGAVGDPASEPAAVPRADGETVGALLEDLIPGGAGRLHHSAPCYYTSTRDLHFAIGRLRSAPGVILASACSGHGFKFASALGEAIAQLVAGNGAPLLPSGLFDVARLE